ncbi:MAG: SpoIVB peptidase [Clostridiales bacterium]|nr:SpoIVB peptidase [Clostridiales bacterium]
MKGGYYTVKKSTKIIKMLAIAIAFTLGGSSTVSADGVKSNSASTAYTKYIAVSGNENRVYICGTPIGIKLYCSGALVVDLQEIVTPSGVFCPAKEAGIQKGDIIKKINGKEINGNSDLISAIDLADGDPVEIFYEHDGEDISKTVTPIKTSENGTCKIGVWVRDSCAGIGTVTYYDQNDHTFAALGHGICDADTGRLMSINNGIPANISIDDIEKSTGGNIGCLIGHFRNDIQGASIKSNTQGGIYGYMPDVPKYSRLAEIAETNEMKCGSAQILTTLRGEIPQYYDVQIEAINLQNEAGKNFVIRVTDQALLKETGGIVQGMSGSPIIQNDKLVGAVTHVFVNYPDKGYGISVNNMLNISKELDNAA